MMRIPTRSKRKLAVLLVLATIGMVGVAGALFVRDKQKLAREVEARADGIAAHSIGDYETAIGHFDYYLRAERNKQDADAIYYYADSRRHVPTANNKHITASISWARDALAYDPHHRPALELLLELYTLIGYRTEALDVAERLIAIEPAHRRALETRVDALAIIGRYEEALAAAGVLAEQHSDDPTAQIAVADALAFVGALLPGGWNEVRARNRALCLEGRRIVADAIGIAPPCPDDMILAARFNTGPK